MFQIFKKSFEFFYKPDIERSVQLDTLWTPNENLWVAFIHKDVSVKNLSKDCLLGFFEEKGFKVTQLNKGAKLVSKNGAKFIETTLGFNDTNERMLHAKFGEEGVADASSYFLPIFTDLAQYLAKNSILRSQKFDPTKIIPYKDIAFENQTKSDDSIRSIVDEDTVHQQEEGIFVIFLSKTVKRETLVNLLLDFSGDQGLTCKLEGKATVKSASSFLSVTMKIGFNDKDDRILHVQNIVTRFGGDKDGTKFSDFTKKLSWKLAKSGYLQSQDKNEDTATNNTVTVANTTQQPGDVKVEETKIVVKIPIDPEKKVDFSSSMEKLPSLTPQSSESKEDVKVSEKTAPKEVEVVEHPVEDEEEHEEEDEEHKEDKETEEKETSHEDNASHTDHSDYKITGTHETREAEPVAAAVSPTKAKDTPDVAPAPSSPIKSTTASPTTPTATVTPVASPKSPSSPTSSTKYNYDYDDEEEEDEFQGEVDEEAFSLR